jgi:hypothetical protein
MWKLVAWFSYTNNDDSGHFCISYSPSLEAVVEIIIVMYPLNDTGSISRSIGGCGGAYYYYYVPFAG